MSTQQASRSTWTIFIDSQRAIDAIVSETVIKDALALAGDPQKITVHHWFGAPVGFGFGSSGAAALSLSLALNEALGLKLSNVRAAQIAHSAEVRCRTGLGTVVAEFTGGLVVRSVPGAPGIGAVRKITRADGAVIAIPLKRIITKSVLSSRNLYCRIASIFPWARQILTDGNGVGKFLRASRRFSDGLGIAADETEAIIQKLGRTEMWSLAMLGQTPFTIVDPTRLPRTWSQIQRIGIPRNKVIVANIATRGAHLIS